MVRFWVVHMTEEMSLELPTSALVVCLTLIAATRKASGVLFFNIITIIGGIFSG